MQKKLVLATHNPGKQREFAALLGSSFVCLSLSQFSEKVPPETGRTFLENALIKARFASEISGLPAIADDSGLCVDYLQGAPGIYSSRFAGNQASDEENRKKLLASLKAAPASQRGAQFVAVLVYLTHPDDPLPRVAQGVWRGEIAMQAKGSEGFGYDPIFYLPEAGCTAAELSANQKNQWSHRAQALQALKNLLQSTVPC